MRELLLSGLLGLLAVGFAAFVVMPFVRPAGLRVAIRRLADARAGGIERYLGRQRVVVAAAAAALGALVLVVYGVVSQGSWVRAVAPRSFGLWVVGSYVLGVTLALLSGRLAAWVNGRACGVTAEAVHRSLDEALRAAVRSAAASALAALGLAVAVVAGWLALSLWLAGPSVGARAALLASLPTLVARLGGVALGAAFVALLAKLGGGLFGKVADIGADHVGQTEAALETDSPNNPATVADLVGDAVGDHAARANGVLATMLLQAFGTIAVAGLLVRANPDLPDALATVLFPLVVQAFSLLACCFGVMVVRTDEREGPHRALTRGIGVASLLHLVAVVGSAKWLLGAAWATWAWCAALGTAGGLVCLLVAQAYADVRFRPLRMLAESARSGPTLATLRGLSVGLEAALLLLVVLGAVAFGAHLLGARTGLQSGGTFGLAVACLGLLGTAPMLHGADGAASLLDSSSGIVTMSIGRERPDVIARARLLDATGSWLKGHSAGVQAVGAAFVCWLPLVALYDEIASSRSGASALGEPTAVLLYVGALAGVGGLLLFLWATLSRLLHAARAFVLELRGQLGRALDAPPVDRGAPPSGGDRPDDAPDDRSAALAGPEAAPTAAQLACIETVSRHALRGMLPPAILGLGFPLLVGAALRFFASGDKVKASAEALVALLFVATGAGTLASLLFSTAGGAWDHAKKFIETGAHGGRYLPDVRPAEQRAPATAVAGPSPVRAQLEGLCNNPTYVAITVGDTIGDALKGLLAPSLRSLVETLVVLALVFLPFFI